MIWLCATSGTMQGSDIWKINLSLSRCFWLLKFWLWRRLNPLDVGICLKHSRRWICVLSVCNRLYLPLQISLSKLEFSIVVSLIWLGHVEWFHFLTLCQTILNCFYNICRCWQQFVVTELEFWFTRTSTNSSFAILHHLIHGNRQWFRDGIQTFDYKFISWSEFFW